MIFFGSSKRWPTWTWPDTSRFSRPGWKDCGSRSVTKKLPPKREGLKELDWSGYIARELRKAGFRGDELDEFVHEIVVKLLVSPGKLFTGWNPRHHGPLDRRFGASVRNQIANIISKRANRRRYLPSVSIGNDGDGVPEDFLPASSDDRTVADFRDLLAQRLGRDLVRCQDAWGGYGFAGRRSEAWQPDDVQVEEDGEGDEGGGGTLD